MENITTVESVTESAAPPVSTPKTYSVGTLTYTSGGIVLLILWLLLGDFAWAMRDRAFGPVSALMLKSYGVSDFFFGFITVSFTNFTGIILGPIISFYSDRYRSRLGRRIPFLIGTTPFVVIGLVGVGFSPQLGVYLHDLLGGDSVISLSNARIFTFCIFWIMLDFGMTLAGGLFNALVNDVVPAELLGRVMGFLRAISLGCAILFNYYLMEYSESHATAIMLGLGILYGAGMLLICSKVKEGQYPAAPVIEQQSAGAFSKVRIYFRECFRLPFYRWVFFASIFGTMTAVPINIYAMFYIKSINMELGDFGKLTALFCTISFVLSFFLGWFSDKFHPIRTGAVALLFHIIILFIAGQVAVDVDTFKVVFFIQNIIIMSYNTLMASFYARLFPKAIFAQMCSAAALINSALVMIIAPILGVILDLTENHYPHVFTAGGIFGLLAVVCFYQVYRYYKYYGGDKNYQAPDPTEDFPVSSKSTAS